LDDLLDPGSSLLKFGSLEIHFQSFSGYHRCAGLLATANEITQPTVEVDLTH
jgi:hypothetical protein